MILILRLLLFYIRSNLLRLITPSCVNVGDLHSCQAPSHHNKGIEACLALPHLASLLQAATAKIVYQAIVKGVSRGQGT